MRDVVDEVDSSHGRLRPSGRAEKERTMPRQARLDAPGTLHHVILRGMERGRIVADDEDRTAFVTRGPLALATGTVLYAWVLLPNHAHLLLRSGAAGLPRFMRRLLTGYALGVSTSGIAKAVARVEPG
jgi:REP element-mobilizing transposase RayT